MLILSRKEGETIVINGDIRVTVVQLAGGKVRLGIEAPRDISVHRQEVHELIQADHADSLLGGLKGKP